MKHAMIPVETHVFWALKINVLFAKLPFLMGKSQLFTPPFLMNHHFCWQTLTISMG